MRRLTEQVFEVLGCGCIAALSLGVMYQGYQVDESLVLMGLGGVIYAAVLFACSCHLHRGLFR